MRKLKKVYVTIITLICISGLIGVGLYFLKSIMPISGVPVTNTIEISSDEDFILHEFPGSGTSEDPYIIMNRTFGVDAGLVERHYIGLEFVNTTKHFVVRNCTFFGGVTALRISNIAEGTANISDNYFHGYLQYVHDYAKGESGIEIVNANGVIIAQNYFVPNKPFGYGGGIRSINSTNCLIINNTFIDDIVGAVIDIENSPNITIIRNNVINENGYFCSATDSPNATILNNFIDNHYLGISLYFCSNALIENNSIELVSGYRGLLINRCFNTTIVNNNISCSELVAKEYYYGIHFRNSNFSIIKYNYILNFSGNAINLDSTSTNNTIFKNLFYNNRRQGSENSQGYDDGIGNLWYNPLLLVGNFWNDLDDSTYLIAGDAGSVDLYPLSSPH